MKKLAKASDCPLKFHQLMKDFKSNTSIDLNQSDNLHYNSAINLTVDSYIQQNNRALKQNATQPYFSIASDLGIVTEHSDEFVNES